MPLWNKENGRASWLAADVRSWLALVVSALVNRFIERAERNNPPIGKFLDVGPSGLDYLEHGTAKPRPFFEK